MEIFWGWKKISKFFGGKIKFSVEKTVFFTVVSRQGEGGDCLEFFLALEKISKFFGEKIW
ncbi:MAG: hypothetical protein GY782_09460 [Gammaproteobacteria bacterium]|nr:hypothetical protein [Gammaproteobacteria bacterium]